MASDYERREAERERLRDWMAAFDDVLAADGPAGAERLLRQLERRAARAGIQPSRRFRTPYVNTLAASAEPRFPGEAELEQRIENAVRWNAMAIVVRANRSLKGIGGHIGSFASAATLFEVGFNHFFRGGDHPEGRDQVYLQGHASPGVYARAFLEGRLSERDLDHFRRELAPGGGLSSYPHPWLMPHFWEYPSVSMGLAPIMAIYQARFDRYLERRGLKEHAGRVWAVLGDGEMDEPESVGGLALASREELGNLTFVIDCNLQRLDGPVRGSGKVIQELEGMFAGAGWRVIKVLWGGDWDPLFEKDESGALVERMDETVDGDWQKYAAEGGAHMREHLFGASPELEKLVEGFSDEDLGLLRRGGHDLRKVYAAYHAAEAETERPTVILAQTIKGWGLGRWGEARNTAHKTKNLDEEGLRAFRDRLGLPIPDDEVGDAPYYRPAEGTPESSYLKERREALGGAVPRRQVTAPPLEPPDESLYTPYFEAPERPATTTMVVVRLLADLLKDERVGELIVPIIPDEARTFGLEALFPQVKIHSGEGQQYSPVDEDQLLSYDESTKGQLLEEGITEAGSISSLIAAGTAYAAHGLNTIPFYFFYSMFGFQRIGDLVWAAEDARARGFLIGATSGRTTLNGEGLQHQDGHSHLIAYAHPTIRAYDPAFGYEVATIVQDGIRRMYVEGEPGLTYITVANEPYEHPAMPKGVRDGILRGMYRYQPSEKSGEVRRVQLLGSGVLLRTALEAQKRLAEDYDVTADVWSVTSWKALYTDGLDVDRDNRLDPDAGRTPYVRECLGDDPGAIVAVSDFVKALPMSLAQWLPVPVAALGTDGFGRSDSRDALRAFFEVDARHVTWAALHALSVQGRFPENRLPKAAEDLGIDPEKTNPTRA